MGLKRGPVALLLARFTGRRTQSGTTGAFSDVSSGRRFAFFFEPTAPPIVLRYRTSGSIARETTLLSPGHADLLDRLAMQLHRLETSRVQVGQVEELVERDEPRTLGKRAGVEQHLSRPGPCGI